jgi:hypothetical protein
MIICRSYFRFSVLRSFLAKMHKNPQNSRAIREVPCLIWQHVSTSKFHLQTGSLKYIKNYFMWYFMYFILLAWRWPSEVEKCCQINVAILTIFADSNLLFSLLYLKQRYDQRSNREVPCGQTGRMETHGKADSVFVSLLCTGA